MKKKLVLRLMSLAVVASMIGTMTPSNISFVSAEDAVVSGQKTGKAENKAVLEDGIHDKWTQENKIGDDAVCAVEDGWLHLKSGTGNGNNPGTSPAMFVNQNTFDFSKEGYFEFTMKSNNVNTAQDNSDRFGVYLGYNTDVTGMFIGYDNDGWFWQKYGETNNPWYQGDRTAAPVQGTEVKVHISWTADKKVTLKLDDAVIFEGEDFSGIANLGDKIAFKGGSWSSHVTDVLLQDIHYTGQKEAETYAVSGKVADAEGNALEGAVVKVQDQEAKTDKNGNYSLELAAGTYELTVAKSGYQTVTKSITVSDGDVTVDAIQMEKVTEVETEKLSTDDMDVYVAKNFPSVVRYEMKGDLEGKTFYGQTSEINTIRINGTDIKLSKDDVETKFEKDKATYTMKVKSGDTIDAVLTAELTAEKNTVGFKITEIKNNLTESTTNKYGQEVETYPIETIQIPNHSLISVRSTQENANLKGAIMSSNTLQSGDELIQVNSEMGDYTDRDYMYAFLSNNEMSAGMWSNSENEGRAAYTVVSGGSHNTRILATTEDMGDYKSMGLASALWYYHRNIRDSHDVWYTVKESEMPEAKVIITGEMNGDKEIDWQDGAVAFREIMNNPYKYEEVPELVAWRIAMNFGGQAQNPFLTTLDNVKKVALHTDGLGQSVLLKGYGNEGHDSGHPDYADIGERIGGEKEMNMLLEKGADYSARFGVHVNASEMYPEAKAFSDNSVRRYVKEDPNMDKYPELIGTLRYGWNWIDQGIGIDGFWDLGTNSRRTRFDELKEKVGDNMDFIYVDVWGNQTSNRNEDSWETRHLTDEITENGWRMTTEWGSTNEYDSTFQHWAADLTYGGYDRKGENSEVMRFLRNHQKDSWVGDYPGYGGAAVAPLLGGYNMKDFEGWQGRNDYDSYITNLYTHDLTTKFIQHYKVMDWEDGDPVTVGNATNWVPEMKITLQDDDEDTLVLERGSNDPNSEAYRERTMTLNGKVVAYGAPSRGDRTNEDIQQGNLKGTETYLLPWIWDADTGEKVADEDEKLYHWNTQGGTTEWELPDGWAGLKTVKVYKLTDLGKTDEQTVAVKDGKITLEAESEVPYVVYKDKEGNLDITWSEGMHIVDASFNSGNFDAWDQSGDGTAEIAKSQHSNPMMKLSGKVSMTQELTDLEAGKQYAVLVGVDNRSDSKASMTVKAGDEVLATNYTTRSIAKNYVKAYAHSTASATVDGSSYFQHMYVFFTAPKSGKVTLTLAREAGEGDTYFDDVRVVQNDSKNITRNEKGEVVKFEQDFENSVQGLYPFVMGGIVGVEDNHIHLSELHDPYTQAGWDVKKMDDVLDGNWSVKINGLTQKSTLAYQTIPQNFRFEPGVTYKVSFDYQSGSEGIYAAAVGSGEYNGKVQLEALPMAMGRDADGHYEGEVTGDSTGQTWFGIYSTSKAPDLQGTSGDAANFGGYKELVLDNLVIEKVEQSVTKSDLEALIQEAKENYVASDYETGVWNTFQKEIAKAQVALDKDNVTQDDIEKAYYALKGAMVTMDNSKGIDSSDDSRDISTEGMTATAGSEQPETEGEGLAEYALDGNENTIWHTIWGGTSTENQWIDIALAEPATVGGLRMLPRTSGSNGIIEEAEIWVKTTESEDYVKVSDAHFGTSGWQAVTFDEIQNVTNVKLQAIHTLGDTENNYASAAEIRLMGEKIEVPVVVDKSGLQAAIDAAKALNQSDYTEETWSVLAEKLAEAEAVMANENATDYDVLLAIANLTDAISALEEADTPEVPEDADKTELNALIAEYAGLKASDYTEDSWKLFESAYAKAKEVAADENATQASVNQAVAALKSAYAGLVEADAKNPEPSKVDKSKAEKFYNDCVAYYKEANHSKANWKAYQEALKELKAVLDNKDATQKEVDNALNKLIDVTAKMNAELKNASDAPKNPVTGKDNVIKTGDSASTIGWSAAGIAAILAIAAAFVVRRKREN